MKLRFYLLILLCLSLLLPMAFEPAEAQIANTQKCKTEPLTPSEKLRWYNPRQSPDDFTLSMPSGLELVFVPVVLAGKGLYGDEKSTYTMGSSVKRVFETSLDVRISSPITDKQLNKSVLLIGKYELSNGQYAIIMGDGQIDSGIETLYARSREAKLKEALLPYVSKADPCYHLLTKEIIDILARPISFLSYRDYVEVIDRFNLYCIRQDACGRKLGTLSGNKDYPAFIRLPTEHEWEFAARGGGAFVAGKLSRKELQQDLPPIPQGMTLKNFAHFGNDPPYLLPIGSRQPLFGIYDMIGNADELMLNPFTAENGFGAVGGHVVRGGSYSLDQADLRVSRRSELASVFWDDDRKVYDIQYFPKVGIRLMLGLPIAGTSERRGSNDVAESFESEYSPVSEAGDIAGDTSADAKDLGKLGPNGFTSNDEIGGTDAKDVFAFMLEEYADIDLSIEGSGMTIELRDSESKVLTSKTSVSNKPGFTTYKFDQVVPGRYELHLLKLQTIATEERYSFNLTKVPITDTGLPTMTTAALGSAISISDQITFSAAGFVGQGDTTDIYPISVSSSKGGVLFEVSQATAPLTIRYLDQSQKVIGESTVNMKTGSISLPIPLPFGTKGFVQVLSDGRDGSLYQLKGAPEILTDSEFRVEPVGLGKLAEGKPYRGYLDPQTQVLYFGIPLADARTLRVELTRLEANIDLDILDEDSNVIASQHMRLGMEPEFFQSSLPAGRYTGRLKLRETDKQSPFQVFVSSFEYKSTGGTEDLKVARQQADSLGSFGSYNNSTSRYITGTGKPQYFKFSVGGTGMVAVDVSGFSSDADLDVMIEDSSGSIVSKSSNVGDKSELAKAETRFGEFFVRVQPAGGSKRYSYTINLSYAEKAREPDLSSYGRLSESFGDWQVREDRDGRCWMVTVAKEIIPELGWRVEKPLFYLGTDKGASTIYMAMDYSDPPEALYTVNTVRGTLVGANTSFKLTFEKSWLKALTRGKNCKANWCVDSDAISAFVRGKSLLVNAKSNEGVDVSFTYGLSGYVKAARAMNKLCKAKVSWIYGQ